MKKKTNPTEAEKISNSSRPLGTVTKEAVRKRAGEIAVINGRSANEILEGDLDQARRELTGGDDEPAEQRFLESVPESERWDPVPGSFGKKVPRQPLDDEKPGGEKMLEEGMEDAEHDQMLRGTKEEKRRDEAG